MVNKVNTVYGKSFEGQVYENQLWHHHINYQSVCHAYVTSQLNVPLSYETVSETALVYQSLVARSSLSRSCNIAAKFF